MMFRDLTHRWETLTSAILALVVLATTALGHPPFSATALIQVERNGQVVVTIRHDALAFALNELPTTIADAPMLELLRSPSDEIAATFAAGRERMAAALRLTADGNNISLTLTESPTLDRLREWRNHNPPETLPATLEFVAIATVPIHTTRIGLQFPSILGDVIWTVERPELELDSVSPLPSEISPDVGVSVGTTEDSLDALTTSTSAVFVAWRYITLGFEHIIPDGTDHALFVLGLFLLSPRLTTVLWQISAFTLAHTLTLTLTTCHVIGMPDNFVEPAIALSIALVGVENLFTTKIHSWRIVIAFLFGLVHGMGVATAFSEVGFSPDQLVSSLAAFTVGVEGGHIAVLAAAFLILGWWRDKTWYRNGIVIPMSAMITVVALYWTVERVM